MIELEALKEQLRALGHELPEEQIIGILREMNIDFDATPAATVNPEQSPAKPQQQSAAAPGSFTLAGEGHAAGQPGVTGEGHGLQHSMMHGMHGTAAADWQQGPANGSWMAAQSYTGRLAAADAGKVHASEDPATMAHLSGGLERMSISGNYATALEAGMPDSRGAQGHGRPSNPNASIATSSSSCHNHAQPEAGVPNVSHDDPPSAIPAHGAAAAVASRQPYEWYGQLAGVAANPHLKLSQPKVAPHRSLLQELDQSASRRVADQGVANTKSLAAAAAAAGRSMRSNSFWEEDEASKDDDYDDDIRVAAAHSRAPPVSAWVPSTQLEQHRASAGLGDSGPQAQQGSRDLPGGGDGASDSEADQEQDDLRYGSRRESNDSRDVRRVSDTRGGGCSHRAGQDRRLRWGGGGASRAPAEAVHTAKVAANRAALEAAAAAALGSAAPATIPARPAKYCWEEHLRSVSPGRSSVLSLPRSSAGTSIAGSKAATRRSQGLNGAKKIDRVERYQELQKDWSKDRFLKFAQGSKPAPGTRQPTAPTRKPLNFHNYFSALHAIEAADRDQMLKQGRSKIKGDLKAGHEYEPPTSKRRDTLRWEMRMRMQG